MPTLGPARGEARTGLPESTQRPRRLDQTRADGDLSGPERAAQPPSARDVLRWQRALGNQAVGRLLERSTAADLTGTPVRRLMTFDAFKAATPGARRNKVVPVDQAVQAYNGLPLANFVNRNTQLTALISACDVYLAYPDSSAKRKPGVRRLKNDAAREQRIVAPMASAESEADEVRRFRFLAQARDAAVEVEAATSPTLNYLMNPLNHLTNACINSVRGTPKERLLVQIDLDELVAMRDDATLPPVLRNVLTEILANTGQTKFEEMLPGATLSAAGVAEKYTVKHSLNAPGGQTERLGSLAHELTHVSIGESFDNTPLFLAFQPGASDAAILSLVAQRGARLTEIESALAADPFLSPAQKQLVESKLVYGKGNKLDHYAKTFFDARKINAAQRDYIRDIATKANNAVIEYDTVVNQMLVYMARWNVPMANALYAKIREVAQEAFDYRRNARLARGG